MLVDSRRWLFSLLFATMTLSAHAAPKTLRVVSDNNYPPYLFLGADGKPQGYIVDLWGLWQQKTGIHVDLEPMQWSAAQKTMHDGKADVIDMIFRTPVRDQLYKFSAPYATQTVGIYVDHSIAGIRNANSLKGFEIGVQRGDACVGKLASLGLTSLIAYPNYKAIIAAAQNDRIKIFCMDDYPANYYLYLYRDNLRFAKAFTLYKGEFHWAVNRGDAATFALVARGMSLITPAERAALRHKWFSHPLQFWPYLRIVLILVLSALGVLLLAALWIWILRRAVRAKTIEVHEKNELLEKQSRELIVEHAQLRTLVESSPDAMWLKNKDGVYIDCNATTLALLGMPREQVIDRTDNDLFSDPRFVKFVRENDQEVLRSGETHHANETIVAQDGSARDMEVIKVPIFAPDGDINGVLGVAHDVTERHHAERELRIASVAFESQDGMVIADPRGVIERVNAAFTQITGFSPSEAIGKPTKILRSGRHDQKFYETMWAALTNEGYWSGEVVNRRKDGALYPARISITAVTDAQDKLIHYVETLQDISVEKEARAQAEYLKLFDPVTGLPNRALFKDRVSHALANCIESKEFGAIMMIDLDHFQKVNDSLGHTAGDKLLVEMSRRMQSVTRGGDTLAHFSGDSFVVMLEKLGPDRQRAAARASRNAENILRTIGEPLRLDGHGVVCTASIGITIFPGVDMRSETLLRQADLALHKSKKSGRNTVRVFENTMQLELNSRYRLEAELREAIEQEQFVLYYQLQVDAQGRPIGAEALVRWDHPVRGVVAPALFIPLAEETGLIEQLGCWVISSACNQLRGWAERQALCELTLAVNVSPRQFKSVRFVEDILDMLNRSGARADKLKLEITESLAIDDFKSSIDKLRELKAHGFGISLDDFGTGNSSLTYLTKLSLMQLKIDKSFVDNLLVSQSDAMIAQTIIAMARGLALDVIAEGVETQAQYEFLKMQGCHAFQGYLFGKPMALSEFEESVVSLCENMDVSRSNPQSL